ncbi:MAG TPA: ferredoxin, partial [Aquifex aeolicus]|nr:ferredoxin [Aquifex aeolicus]
SEVYKAIQERNGFVLFPDMGTNPANHYLPRIEAKINLEEFEKHVLRPDNPLFLEVMKKHHVSSKSPEEREVA